MAGLAGADLAVRRRVRLATGVADTRRTYAPEPLECGLRGPESAECEVCDLGVATGGTGGIDRVLSLSAHLGRFAMFGAHAPLAAGVSRAITQHRPVVASIRTHKLHSFCWEDTLASVLQTLEKSYYLGVDRRQAVPKGPDRR